MNKTLFLYTLLGCIVIFIASFSKHDQEKNTNLTITFRNTANGKPIVLRDSMYLTPFNESYSIRKLKYYISNISLGHQHNKWSESESYHLVDASRENSFKLMVPPGVYTSIHFIPGVDSARNCSGAQSGALDPLNDMFWTWNTGYVMFKMEGNSSSSNADLNRIEHHIGGFKGIHNTIRNVQLAFSKPIVIDNKTLTELLIETNIDRYWKGPNDIRITELPVNTTTGEQAKKSADNFPGMFSIIMQ